MAAVAEPGAESAHWPPTARTRSEQPAGPGTYERIYAMSRTAEIAHDLQETAARLDGTAEDFQHHASIAALQLLLAGSELETPTVGPRVTRLVPRHDSRYDPRSSR